MTQLPLIPTPSSVLSAPGALDPDSLVRVTAADERALVIAERFRSDLASWTGRSLDAGVCVGERAAASVHFEVTGGAAVPAVAPGSLGDHTVLVDERGITVSAADTEGLARGAASAVQLLGTTDAEHIPFSRIEDRAAWGWRGLSLDVVRFFSPIERIRQVIDLLALYKFNVLHLHLSDNEGWRLAIPGWPLLTPATDGPREFYTLEEYRDLVQYAQDRFITIVPEIDLPGHAAAALRAYPELNPVDAAALGGAFPIANLATDSPRAWALVDDVVRTLAENTPGPFIHIGGDEAFGMDAAAHEAFVERAVERVVAAGKRTIGWQETSRAAIGPAHTAQYWVDFVIDDSAPSDEPGPDGVPEESLSAMAAHFREAMHDGQRIVSKGSRVIVSPISHAYMDRPHAERSLDEAQEQARSRIGLAYYPGTSLREYLEWDAVDVLPGLDRERISGVEGALWCESVTEASDIDALLLPRLTAIAEVAWAGSARAGWERFRDALAAHPALWEAQGWRWFQADTVEWRRTWVRS
ncbi:MAG: family 20 glycosylhydrolase [Microbacterium sp.]|uniref:family 20 glycosylhydrolase n=1 Tax=Microbacterium sp. TaxID=51671 RepID=UPI003D6EFF87